MRRDRCFQSNSNCFDAVARNFHAQVVYALAQAAELYLVTTAVCLPQPIL